MTKKIASFYPAEPFAESAARPISVHAVKNCNHFYQGCEEEVGELIGEWLAALDRTLPPTAPASHS